MRAAAPDALLVAKSNAGMPELVDLRAVYRTSPAIIAAAALTMVEAGAAIVGGCCGTTPDHLAAMARAAILGPRETGSIDLDTPAILH
jgi:methionine synthase I (cobalamin-dependent)